MRKTVRTIIIISAVLMLTSCGSRKYNALLADVESYIQERPDSALAVLEGFDPEELHSEASRAKYALLYSMALDKNYIDLTTDSIIAPAVKYYKRHGSAEDKFKTLYYQGRIFQNDGDADNSMRVYVEAERYVSSKLDAASIARLYKAKAVIYQNIFDFSSAIKQTRNAARYYLEAKDTTRYFNMIIDNVVLNTQLDNKENANDYLDILSSNYNSLSQSQKNKYHALLLNWCLVYSPEQVDTVLSEYLSAIQDEKILNWLFITEAYISLRNYNSARAALDKYIYYGGQSDESFYWISATLNEKMGLLANALEAFKEYLKITDDKDLIIFESDTKFIEERYKAEIKELKQSLVIVVIAFSLLVLVLVMILLRIRIRRIKKERILERIRFDEEREVILDEKNQAQEKYLLLKEDAEKMYTSLQEDISRLKKVRKGQSINKEIKLAVERRLSILNMFVLGEMTDSCRKIAYDELKRLIDNREKFMESTKQTFLASNPKFIEYLRLNQLTEWEIGFCCLYCIGFNSNEISDYLDRKAIYNVSSTIRKKLGIPKGKTRIDLFLKQKMAEFQSE